MRGGQVEYIGQPGFVAPSVEWRGRATLGPGCCVGYPVSGVPNVPTIIGDDVVLGVGCVIETGAVLEDGVRLDHYCRVGTGSRIGTGTRLLYAAQVFEDCVIGARCIIGGGVDDRVIIEDDVTYMGEMAHSYRQAGSLATWDTEEQPSPIIRCGAVVGMKALLVGNVEIGRGAYVAAGEIVRCSVPAGMLLMGSRLTPLSELRGMIRARSPETE